MSVIYNYTKFNFYQYPGHLVDTFTLFFSFPFNRDSSRKKLHPPLYFTKLFPSLLPNATQFWRKIRWDRFIFTKIMLSPCSRSNKRRKKGDLWLCHSNYFFTNNVGLLNHITGQFLFFGDIYIVFAQVCIRHTCNFLSLFSLYVYRKKFLYSFVHFFGIESVSSYFFWLKLLLLDLKMRKKEKKERQTFRSHMGALFSAINSKIHSKFQ